jgi:hypothetical protein
VCPVTPAVNLWLALPPSVEASVLKTNGASVVHRVAIDPDPAALPEPALLGLLVAAVMGLAEPLPIGWVPEQRMIALVPGHVVYALNWLGLPLGFAHDAQRVFGVAQELPREARPLAAVAALGRLPFVSAPVRDNPTISSRSRATSTLRRAAKGCGSLWVVVSFRSGHSAS